MKTLEEKIQSVVLLNQEELETLTSLFTLEHYPKHAFFAKHGEYSHKMAFVKSGILRAFFQTDKGEQYNKTFFKEGDFLGAYASLLNGKSSLIDIQCLTKCELLTADYRSFTGLYDEYPRVERIARIMAEQFFIQKEKREIELVTLEAKERYQILKIEHPTIEQNIPQYHIASYLGITATQLSRIRAHKE